jgi:hypothetical protein
MPSLIPIRIALLVVLPLLMSRALAAETITVGLDRWMYPFAFTGGTRNLSPTFGAVGTPGFDNRDAQFLVGFDTSPTIAPGQGAERYEINSATVRVMVAAPSGFQYDPTYDPFRTYLPDTDPEALVDADVGRPIELHGIGFRNGYTRLSFAANDNQPPGFEESSTFGLQEARARNAYPLGYLSPAVGSDVSNNIDDRVESQPWAIGSTALAPGAPVADHTTFTFAIDLANADVRSYLQRGLNEGALGFAITSMHAASQAGGPPTPQFITRENTGAGAAPAVLEIDYQIIPEPATVGLAAIGATIALLFVRMGQRRCNK